MKIIDLFSGIGGFSLAGHWLGWETELFCERDIYCQRVLRHHFPGIPIYNDVTTLTEQIKGVHNFESDNFILTGGFPCQPFSQAGKRKGRDDERALFPAMLDVIRGTQPKWVLGENVGGILSIESGDYFEHEVCTPLESLGYEIQTLYISASSVGAPHRRDRIWILAKRNDVIENTKRGRFVRGESPKEGAEVRQFRDISTGYPDGLHISKRSASDTTSERYGGTEQLRKSESTSDSASERYIQRGKTDKRPGKDEKPDRFAEEDSLVDTHTPGDGLQRGGNARILRGAGQGREQRSTDLGGFSGTELADTESNRRQHAWGTRTGWAGFKDTYTIPNWDNFPTTEPVIRTGDDGLSFGLVDITLPKWRKETIKMLGNSIVPQVAFQIYRAILHTEQK